MLIFNVMQMQLLIHKEISINRYDVHEIRNFDINDILDTLCTCTSYLQLLYVDII